jgi:hypothetical protein
MDVLGFFGTRRRKSYRCDICNAKFAELEIMEEHRRQVHKDAAPTVGGSSGGGSSSSQQ